MSFQSKLTYAVAFSSTIFALSSCNLPGASSASDAGSLDTSGLNTSDGSSSSGGGGTSSSGGGSSSGGSSSGTPGVNCLAHNGSDPIANYSGSSPYFIVTDASGLSGSVTTVDFQLWLSDSSGNPFTGGTSYTTAMTLTAYQCVPPSGSLGSSVGSAALTEGLNGTAKVASFVFSQPVTVPTNCASGDYPLVFKLTTTSGYNVWAESNYVASGNSCYLPESTAGNSPATRSWSVAIVTQ